MKMYSLFAAMALCTGSAVAQGQLSSGIDKANIEFANELAELLCLANIPNAKKDELYAKHVEGVHKLEAAEEVKSDDGNEA